MPATVGSLQVLFRADLGVYGRDLARADSMTARTADHIDRRIGKLSGTFRVLSRDMGGVASALGSLRTLIPALAGGALVRGFLQAAEASTRMSNALKIAGLSGKELQDTQAALTASALRNAAPVESLVELYGKLKLSQGELKVSNSELLNFTDGVATALRVSGKSAAEASGALLQLSQALAGGTVRAEEFNSILEGATPIAQAVADGLEEARGSIAKLRQLVIDGRVSSQAFFRAFEVGSETLRQKAAAAVLTTSQRLENLKTALIAAAGQFDTATGASAVFGRGIANAASNVDSLTAAIIRNRPAIEAFVSGLSSFFNAGDSAAGAVRTTQLRDTITSTSSEIARLQAELAKPAARDPAFAGQVDRMTQKVAALRGQLAAAQAELYRLQVAGRPAQLGTVPTAGGREKVSITDFPAARSASGVSGPSISSSAKVAGIETEMQAIRDRTDALRFESSIVGMSATEQSRLRVERELTNAALRDGTEITPTLAAQIRALAGEYSSAEGQARALAESTRRAADATAFAQEVATGFAGDLVSSLREGESAMEAFRHAAVAALDKMIAKLIEAIIQQTILNALSGFAGGGGSAAIVTSSLPGGGMAIAGFTPGSLFHSGGTVGSRRPMRTVPASAFAGAPRFHSGLRNDEIAAILQRGETVLTKDQTSQAAERLGAVAGDRGGGRQNINIAIDARGAQKGVAEEIEARLRKFANEEMYGLHVAHHQKAVSRRALR